MAFALPTGALGDFTPMHALTIPRLLPGDDSMCVPTLLLAESDLMIIFHFSRPANISFSLISLKVLSLMDRMQRTNTGATPDASREVPLVEHSFGTRCTTHDGT